MIELKYNKNREIDQLMMYINDLESAQNNTEVSKDDIEDFIAHLSDGNVENVSEALEKLFSAMRFIKKLKITLENTSREANQEMMRRIYADKMKVQATQVSVKYHEVAQSFASQLSILMREYKVGKEKDILQMETMLKIDTEYMEITKIQHLKDIVDRFDFKEAFEDKKVIEYNKRIKEVAVAKHLNELIHNLNKAAKNMMKFDESFKERSKDALKQFDEDVIKEATSQAQVTKAITVEDGHHNPQSKQVSPQKARRLARYSQILRQIEFLKNKDKIQDVPESVLDELKNKLLEDKETYQITKQILDSPSLSLTEVIDLINEYITSLNHHENPLTVKDCVQINEQKFLIDPIPVELMLLEGKIDNCHQSLKDAITISQIYFRKNFPSATEEPKNVQKFAETQTCDDIHFEQIKIEIKKQRRYFQNKKLQSYNQIISSLDNSKDIVEFIDAIKDAQPANVIPQGAELLSPEETEARKSENKTAAKSPSDGEKGEMLENDSDTDIASRGGSKKRSQLDKQNDLSSQRTTPFSVKSSG